MNKNTLCQVRPDHPHHPNRKGYFQFLGGPNADCLVMTEQPDLGERGYKTYFAVGLDDASPIVTLTG